MKIKEAISIFKYHQKSNHKKRTIDSYNFVLKKFESVLTEREFTSIGSEEIYQFLENLTGNFSKSTRRLRYAQIKTFFNFIIDKFNLNIKNPCSSSLLSKSFKLPSRRARKILDKEFVDEMIYNTKCLRDRLIMELQARCGLRI